MQISERLAAILQEVDTRIYEALVSSTSNLSKGDFLDLSSKPCEISYLPANRQGDGDPYENVSKRVSGKPVRILKQFIDASVDPWGSLDSLDTSFNNLTLNHFTHHANRQRLMREISDRDWEVFLYTFESYAKTPNLKLVKGEDIRKYYKYTTYNTKLTLPELNASCMRGEAQQPYFDVYVKNNNVSMLIELEDDGTISGRALVWECDDGTVFMDRVYGNERTVKIFWRYAKQMGWYRQSHNGYARPTSIVGPDGRATEKLLQVSIDNHYGMYPYMDTMKYVYRKAGTFDYCLRNHETYRGEDTYVRLLTGTHG